MLDLPDKIDVTSPDGSVAADQPMWTYWALQEGTLEVDPREFKDNDGNFPPVMHVDSDAPLYDDIDGGLITDRMWGIYYKPDLSFGGVQGGAARPQSSSGRRTRCEVDPYGPKGPSSWSSEDFVRQWTSALAHCHGRFEGKSHFYRREPSGGMGAFTPDSFPVFDVFRRERVRDRRLQPRVQDARRRRAGGQGAGRSSRRPCSNRSGSRGSP